MTVPLSPEEFDEIGVFQLPMEVNVALYQEIDIAPDAFGDSQSFIPLFLFCGFLLPDECDHLIEVLSVDFQFAVLFVVLKT